MVEQRQSGERWVISSLGTQGSGGYLHQLHRSSVLEERRGRSLLLVPSAARTAPLLGCLSELWDVLREHCAILLIQ